MIIIIIFSARIIHSALHQELVTESLRGYVGFRTEQIAV